ncbi:tRNA (adenosine(37)-N6)-threonylcarbamoyltransferase complex dimerization subunit type 1 TsaB [Candidatus Saccharibacteria bacterium]|nr:tRNA (adenosine(37)-N6)-threonylcarbamoyltransferase complex dimerization subunit type 1 TsaB [Candidatus Saccharibacteria bacterium]
MILLLDTSTAVCKLTIVDGEQPWHDEWQADRTLASNVLSYLEQQLKSHNKTWDDITGIGCMKGPGSFTGLRIGMTVLNTIADTTKKPIVGETGEDWQQKALDRLMHGENDRIVLPEYGRDATITKPRK